MTLVTHRTSADDRAFRELFEAGDWPAGTFDHRAHVRLAYVHLTGLDDEAAHAAVRAALLNYLAKQGIDPAKYHETMTRAWVLAVRHFMEECEPCGSAEEFLTRNPRLLDSRIMGSHYTDALLFSARARAAFVEPDRAPIPRHDGS